ncbi:metalloregulator ArsR/SmtB family transcription factor [Mycoplasmatota bacterium WC44]
MRLVEILKMVSEPTRIRIINLLLEKVLCVCELQEILNLPQVTVSKHMSKLRENNIVESEKIAQRVFYRLTDEIKSNQDLINLIKNNRNDLIFVKDLEQEIIVNETNRDYKCPTN